MADNTVINPGTGGDTIATDDIAGVKYQIIKAAYGALDTATLVTATNGLPTSQIDSNATGTITATDTLAGVPAGNGVVLSTAPTAASFVALAIPGGGSQVDIQIKGTATGTYYFEQSMDSTTGSDGTWIATNFRQTGIVNTVLGFSATTVGIFRGNAAGFTWVRVRNVGGTTPSNAVIIRVTNGSGTSFMNASLPSGTNTIGGVTGSQGTPTTAAWTSATTVNTTAGVSVTGMNTVTLAMSNTATMTGGVLTFEVSPDNTNWFPIAMARVDSFTVETAYTLSTVANRAWSTSVDGFTNFRVRLSTVITGTGTATLTLTPQTFAIEPIVNAGITDGTTTSNNLASDTGQNAQLTAGNTKTVAFTTTTVQSVGATDALNYSGVSVHIVTQGTSSTVTFQTSNDNTNWVTNMMYNISATGTAVVGTSTTANTVYTGQLGGRYFRLNVTGISAGTTAGSIVFNQRPPWAPVVLASAVQSGSWTIRQAASITSSGILKSKILAAATTNATSVKASAGQLYGWHFINTTAAIKYVRIYNLATAPTVGTSSPDFVLPLPASGGAVMAVNDMGIPMTTGIAYAITGGATDLDATAVAANDVIGTLFYI